MRVNIESDSMRNAIRANFVAHENVFSLMSQLEAPILRAGELMVKALAQSGRILFCGNGGSAADAQHLSAELSGRYLLNRPPLDAVALHTNTSALTAIGNDFGYAEVFARQLEAHGRAGDVLVAISTGGNSVNIVRAAEQARKMNISVIAMTGAKKALLWDTANVILAVPSTETPRIQEMHILIGHTLCELVESAFFGTDDEKANGDERK